MNRWALAFVAGGILLVALVASTGFVAGDWEGTDHELEHQIERENPEFEPWITPLLEPPSAEIESLLFSLQVGVGALVIGYVVGSRRLVDDESE